LDNVFRGIPVSDETKAAIAARYARFGGVSPINAETRAFISALKVELDANGPALPIYWGNRNWHPFLEDAFEQMSRDGVRRAIACITSVFSSYSSCRKYRENLYEAAASVANPPIVDRLRSPFNHPLFIEAVAARVSEALERVPAERRDAVPLLFTAHSLPESMARRSPYEAQLDQACRCFSWLTACPGLWRSGSLTRRSSIKRDASSATRSSISAGGSSIRATTHATAPSRGSGRISPRCWSSSRRKATRTSSSCRSASSATISRSCSISITRPPRSPVRTGSTSCARRRSARTPRTCRWCAT